MISVPTKDTQRIWVVVVYLFLIILANYHLSAKGRDCNWTGCEGKLHGVPGIEDVSGSLGRISGGRDGIHFPVEVGNVFRKGREGEKPFMLKAQTPSKQERT